MTRVTVSLSSRPPLAFVLPCYQWTKNFDVYRKVNANGVSAQTRAEIDTGRTSPVRDPKADDTTTGDARFVRGIPDGLRMVETAYTELLEERGWVKWLLDIWQRLMPGWSRAQLEQARLSAYDPFRFVANKKENAQDSIVAAGAVVKIGSLTTKGGRPAYEIETLKGNGDPPDMNKINPWLTPWFFFRGVTSMRSGYMSGLRWLREDIVEQWWQLGGADVWFPLLSPTGTNWLDASRVRVLGAEPIPSPYHA